MKKNGEMAKKNESKGESSKKTIIICYECKKSGHIKAECPMLKKKENRKEQWWP